MAHGVEVAEVAEQEPVRVAEPPVRVGEAVEDLGGDVDVLRVVLGGHPEPEDLGAILRQELLGADDVAHRLRHLAGLGIDDEAAGEHRLVGRRSTRRHRLQQRRVRPPAMLVRALQVELPWPA